MPPYPDSQDPRPRDRDGGPPSYPGDRDNYDPNSQRPRRPHGSPYGDASPGPAGRDIPPPPIGPYAKPKKGHDPRQPSFPDERSYLNGDAPDLERKVSPYQRDFRSKRSGYQDDEGDALRRSKRGDDESDRPRRPKPDAYADDKDPRDFGPDPRRDTRGDGARARPPPPGKARGNYYDEDAPTEMPQPRRRQTERAPRRRPQYDYDDDEDDYEPRRRPAPRRRSEDDDNNDRGYRSDGRNARRRGEPREDRGYRSHGEDSRRKRRDDYGDNDDDYDDRPRRRPDARDDRRRSDNGRDDYWREKSRDRDRDRRHRSKYGDEDDGYDDRRHKDKSRRDKDKDKRKWNEKVNKDDIGRYVKTGQKHYEQWAPVLIPVAKSLAKQYMDSRR